MNTMLPALSIVGSIALVYAVCEGQRNCRRYNEVSAIDRIRGYLSGRPAFLFATGLLIGLASVTGLVNVLNAQDDLAAVVNTTGNSHDHGDITGTVASASPGVELVASVPPHATAKDVF